VRLLFLLFPVCCTLCAQTDPQFVWQGQVDGIAILHLAGKRLAVQIQDGSPVEDQKYHFFDSLPGTEQQARLEVLKGRGYVHIIDQPNLENHYTLAVAIEDRQPGSALYAIDLYWDTSSNRFEGGSRKTDRVVWRGRVNEDAIISCQKQSCASSVAEGPAVADEHFKFSHALPSRDLDVRLDDAEGRGEIRVIEQPRERNHYTAKVSIRDRQPGAGEYSFMLVWNRATSNDAEPIPEPSGRGFLWSGTVDGRVRVTLQAGASFSEVLVGAPIAGEHAEIFRPLPPRSNMMLVIRKLHGRGRVTIVESPSEQNHYRLIFEIDDPGPGNDSYEIELDW